MTAPFRGSDSDLTRHQLEGKRFERLSRDLYLLRPAETDLATRVAAAQLVYPDAPACLTTAATLLGLPVDDDGVVHLARGRTDARSERAGVKVHRFAVDPAATRDVNGLLVTDGPRTFVDLARELSLEDLVVVGDVVVRRWSSDAVAEAVRRNGRRKGVTRARLALPLLDPGSDSPPETRGRLQLHAAGFTSLRHQVTVHAQDGGWLGVPDLADPLARVAWQYEGAAHFAKGVLRRKKDIARDEVVRAEGWQVVTTTSLDRREHLIERMTQAYFLAARLWGRDVLPPHLR